MITLNQDQATKAEKMTSRSECFRGFFYWLQARKFYESSKFKVQSLKSSKSTECCSLYANDNGDSEEYRVSEPVTLVANIGGMIYKINENLSIDLGLKTGLNKAEPDYTVLAGIIIDF